MAHVLEIDGLAKRYGETVALDGMTFAVQPGQMYGFVGPNGAGKTTTMRVILGVLAPDAGQVRWQGRPVDAEMRRRFGYMPEERGLYPKMRVRDQLVYFAQLHGMSAADAGRSADHWIDALGLAERAGDPVEKLSLGNQQRVQLAAALVHEPEVLVLDEPFSGLDPVGVDVLASALMTRVHAGVPVVFSSHQLDLVERLCDAVGIIKAGRMVASGPVDALRREEAAKRPARLRVRVHGTDGTWAKAVPTATVVDTQGDTVVVELADGASPDAVLDAARAAGSVREFTELEPSLTELFRGVVAA